MHKAKSRPRGRIDASFRTGHRPVANSRGTEAVTLSQIATDLMDIALESPGGRFFLPAAAGRLRVPRRRIYDVTNVWEAVGIARRAPGGRPKGGWDWIGRPGFDAFRERVQRADPADPRAFLASEQSNRFNNLMRRTVVAVCYCMTHPQRVRLPDSWSRQQFHALVEEASVYCLATEPNRRAYDLLNVLLSLSIIKPAAYDLSRAHDIRFVWTPQDMNPARAVMHGVKIRIETFHITDAFEDPLPAAATNKAADAEEQEPQLDIDDDDDDEHELAPAPIGVEWEMSSAMQHSIMTLMPDAWDEDTRSSSASAVAVGMKPPPLDLFPMMLV